LITRARKNTDP